MNPKHKIKKIYSQINYWLGVVAVGLAVGLSIQFAVAWKEPTEAPPGGDLLAPLNVSSVGQEKAAGLTVNKEGVSSTGLIVNRGIESYNGNVDVNNNRVVNVAWPSDNKDAASKEYVDAQSGGGGSYVVVVENDSGQAFSLDDLNTIASFISNGGVISHVECNLLSGSMPTYMWQIDAVSDGVSYVMMRSSAAGPSAGIICCTNFAPTNPGYANSCYMPGSVACSKGWKIIGVDF